MRHKYIRNREKTNRIRGQSLKPLLVFSPLWPCTARCVRNTQLPQWWLTAAPSARCTISRWVTAPRSALRPAASSAVPQTPTCSPSSWASTLLTGTVLKTHTCFFLRFSAIMFAQWPQKLLVIQSIAVHLKGTGLHLAVYFFIMFSFWFIILSPLHFVVMRKMLWIVKQHEQGCVPIKIFDTIYDYNTAVSITVPESDFLV